jgi:hypothetical protein
MTMQKHKTHGAMPGTATSNNTPALYEHPDGHLIGFDGGTLICIGDHDTAFMPIAPYGMKLLAYRLLALATELEGSN